MEVPRLGAPVGPLLEVVLRHGASEIGELVLGDEVGEVLHGVVGQLVGQLLRGQRLSDGGQGAASKVVAVSHGLVEAVEEVANPLRLQDTGVGVSARGHKGLEGHNWAPRRTAPRVPIPPRLKAPTE